MTLWNVIENMIGYQILTLKNKKDEVVFSGCVVENNFYKKEISKLFDKKVNKVRIVAYGYYEAVLI